MKDIGKTISKAQKTYKARISHGSPTSAHKKLRINATTHKKLQRTKGHLNLVKSMVSHTDKARDEKRVGIKSPGISMSYPHMKKKPGESTKAHRTRTGADMARTSHALRGGLSMSGMGDHKDPTKQKALKKAAKYGTKTIRVQKAIKFLSDKARGKHKEHPLTEAHTDRYKSRMQGIKTKRAAAKKK